MVTISTGGGGGMPEPGDSASGRFDREAAEQGEQKLKHKKAAAKMATVRSGHFIIGYLLRNLRISFQSLVKLPMPPSVGVVRGSGTRDCKSSTARI
jgi:hypothetical protein